MTTNEFLNTLLMAQKLAEGVAHLEHSDHVNVELEFNIGSFKGTLTEFAGLVSHQLTKVLNGEVTDE